ncbi:MAG: VWA domain-containing protein [Candidatus Binatia bacterium]
MSMINCAFLKRFFPSFLFAGFFLLPHATWSAQPKIQIKSPKDGSRITQAQNRILISGKVSTGGNRTPNVDIVFVIDVSGSTAHYAGVDLGDSVKLPSSSGSTGLGNPQIKIFGGGFGMSGPPIVDLRNSILGAEIAGAHRLLSQLNPQTTRVGLVTFGENARVRQPLTHDFNRVKQALDEIFIEGPYGGTHMVGGIRGAIKELAGLGHSRKRTNAVKVQFLLTDGFPTLPIGRGNRAAPEDTNLAINAARIAGKAGIKIHVFALGGEALSYPRAAVGIARESGGIFTPVVRPADILAVLENISVVGVDYVEVLNKTTGRRASQLRLGADGFFSSALPVTEGLNRIQVFARASDGAVGQDSISVYYQSGKQRSLDLEVFIKKEKDLKLQVERLGKSKEDIQREIDRSREDSLRRSQQPPPLSNDTVR